MNQKNKLEDLRTFHVYKSPQLIHLTSIVRVCVCVCVLNILLELVQLEGSWWTEAAILAIMLVVCPPPHP